MNPNSPRTYYPALLALLGLLAIAALFDAQLPAQTENFTSSYSGPGELTTAPQPGVATLESTTQGMASDTTTWKTYSSSAVGISLRYPPSWSVSQRSEQAAQRVDLSSPDKTATVAIIRRASPKSGSPTSYEEEVASEFRRSQDIFEAQQRSGRHPTPPEQQQILVDGQPATAISYVSFWERAGQYVKTTNIFEKNHNLWIALLIYQYTDEQAARSGPLLEKMLSTLRFQP